MRQAPYSAALVDIRLPDLDGYEAFKRLREVQPNVPIILMTGFGWDPTHSIVKARQEGLANRALQAVPRRPLDGGRRTSPADHRRPPATAHSAAAGRSAPHAAAPASNPPPDRRPLAPPLSPSPRRRRRRPLRTECSARKPADSQPIEAVTMTPDWPWPVILALVRTGSSGTSLPFCRRHQREQRPGISRADT